VPVRCNCHAAGLTDAAHFDGDLHSPTFGVTMLRMAATHLERLVDEQLFADERPDELRLREHPFPGACGRRPTALSAKQLVSPGSSDAIETPCASCFADGPSGNPPTVLTDTADLDIRTSLRCGDGLIGRPVAGQAGRVGAAIGSGTEVREAGRTGIPTELTGAGVLRMVLGRVADRGQIACAIGHFVSDHGTCWLRPGSGRVTAQEV
jgi:hypothetical protein